jgi:hypothetical protein
VGAFSGFRAAKAIVDSAYYENCAEDLDVYEGVRLTRGSVGGGIVAFIVRWILDWYANVGVGNGLLWLDESLTCVRSKRSHRHQLLKVISEDIDDR